MTQLTLYRTQFLNPNFRGNYSNIEEMLLHKGFEEAGEIDNENPKILLELYERVKNGRIADWKIVPTYMSKDGSDEDEEDVEANMVLRQERERTHMLYIKYNKS